MEKNLKAIVIDDDFDTVEVFSLFLDLLSIKTVGTGHNGKDAVDLYKSLQPDIVFLDLMMPDYDGFYALENIRKSNPYAYVAIITADIRTDTIQKLKLLDPNKILYKPYEREEILEIINELTKQKIISPV
jgi:two-component system, chemotaxis family, chemotaxis protein CheY